MEETIKSKQVIAYKGMNSDMTCRGFQYELGKSYKTDKVELYECGFHACLNPRDVLDYYFQEEGSRYFKVKLSGEITKCGNCNTNVAATEITILEEITDNFNEAIKNTEWWKNDDVLHLLYWSDGFAKVQRTNDEWNFINKDGKILLDEWFNWVDDFKDGFARVQRGDELWNFIDTKGNILLDEWYKWVDDFHDGFARVQRTNDEWNFINKQGNIVSNEWFIDAYSFVDGFAIVEREDYLYNFIDRQGIILSNEWFDYVGKFNDGLADVKRTNGEWAKIDKTGKLIKLQ